MFRVVCFILMVLFCIPGIQGCGEKEPSQEELLLGNWTQYRNRAYVLLILSAAGTWNSSVRIADATSKIVKAKGSANGTWHMEDKQLIFTVIESDIQEIWEKNDSVFFEIVELGPGLMILKEENGRVVEWKKTVRTQGRSEGEAVQFIPMPPFAVNLNKHSSNAKDQYLCLNMKLILNELMPEQDLPKLHPRARDAAIMFLSGLVDGDVENFERIKVQKKKMVDVLNPYMEGIIKDIEIEHVIIASSVVKVEEFIIEHTLGNTKETEGEDAKDKDGEKTAEQEKNAS